MQILSILGQLVAIALITWLTYYKLSIVEMKSFWTSSLC
jgi:hypothetical protein